MSSGSGSPGANVVHLAPALTINEAHIDQAVTVLGGVLVGYSS